MRWLLLFRFRSAFSLVLLLAAAAPVRAQDRLCDPGNEDCRAILINYIRNETVAIDVAFWFMEDARYTNELILKWRAGIPVRVLIDPRANTDYPLNAQRLAELQAAGIPMRKRLTSNILHWKMMLFHAQNVVEFSGANYSADAWRPTTATAYENYVDEAIYFTADTAIVNSFRTRFDDQWIDTAGWANYANVAGALVRRYGVFPKDPSLNFPPAENYRTRSVNAYDAERRRIDVIMYRITDRAHADKMLAAVSRGIPVRLITEPEQYRDASRMWHAWNVDRLYMGGVHIRQRAHQGLNHQKSVILYDQDPAGGDQPMVIFGSSNWTSPSASGQLEHNIFTTKPPVVSWFINQFERKWNNYGGVLENVDFVPLPPDVPKNPGPASGARNVATTVTLTWSGGPWAHLYDVYLDTNPEPYTAIAVNLAESSSKTATSTFSYQYPVKLRPRTTYYWRVVSKTMALQTQVGPVWSFTTGAPPECAGGPGDFDGDCRGDITVFRPSSAVWYTVFSGGVADWSGFQWGLRGDVPAPADYDGDGRVDVAVFRPYDPGGWYIWYSSLNRPGGGYWGLPGDTPVPADYDGDGKADFAVFRPSTAEWWVLVSSNYAGARVRWGLLEDVPVPADYDGDGRADLAVFRPYNGTWYIRYARGGTAQIQWGLNGDIPVPADYDGDGRIDCAVFRPSNATWYVLNPRNGAVFIQRWGLLNDVPMPVDYDGDGKADLTVFRPSNATWYVRHSANGSLTTIQWGLAGDIPIF